MGSKIIHRILREWLVRYTRDANGSITGSMWSYHVRYQDGSTGVESEWHPIELSPKIELIDETETKKASEE